MTRTTSYRLMEPLIGRDADVASIIDAMNPGGLVTILGPPGIGATRVAAAAASQHSGSVLWADAAGAHDDAGLTERLAAALGVSWSGLDEAHQALQAAIAGRPGTWVVIDELSRMGHFDAIEALRVAGAAVLVTANAPLRLPGERQVTLQPLSPVDGAALYAETAGRNGVEVDVSDPTISALVKALDGLPLAIELAATRARVLPAASMLERLAEHRFTLLRTREQSLHAAVELVWQDMHPDEKQALTQAAVFAGPFTLEAAEAVIQTEESTALLVDDLAARSLLQTHNTDPVAFGLPATLREWVCAHAPPGPDTVLRHRAWSSELARRYLQGSAPIRAHVADLVACAEDRTASPDQVLITVLALLKAAPPQLPYDRLFSLATASLPHLSQPGITQVQLAIGALLTRRSRPERAVEHLEAARQTCPPELLPRLHLLMAEALLKTSRFTDSQRAAEVALSGDLGVRGRARRILALNLAIQRDLAGAAKLFDQASRELDEGGDPAMAAECRARRLVTDLVSRSGISPDTLQESIRQLGRLATQVEDPHQALRIQVDVSHRLLLLGRFDEASQILETSLAKAVLLGEHLLAARGRHSMGCIAHAIGHLEQAEGLLRESYTALRHSRFGPEVGADLAHLYLEQDRQLDAHELVSEIEVSGSLGQRVLIHAVRGITSVMLGHDPGNDLTFANEHAVPMIAPCVAMTAAIAEVIAGDVGPALEAIGRGGPLLPDQLARRVTVVCINRFSPESSPDLSLRLGHDVSWFQIGSRTPADLRRRAALRAIVRELVDARCADPERRITKERLVEAGWPGERILEDAAASRVYTAIRTLRKMGLEPILLTDDGGYRLDPRTVVQRLPSSHPPTAGVQG